MTTWEGTGVTAACELDAEGPGAFGGCENVLEWEDVVVAFEYGECGDEDCVVFCHAF